MTLLETMSSWDTPSENTFLETPWSLDIFSKYDPFRHPVMLRHPQRMIIIMGVCNFCQSSTKIIFFLPNLTKILDSILHCPEHLLLNSYLWTPTPDLLPLNTYSWTITPQHLLLNSYPWTPTPQHLLLNSYTSTPTPELLPLNSYPSTPTPKLLPLNTYPWTPTIQKLPLNTYPSTPTPELLCLNS